MIQGYSNMVAIESIAWIIAIQICQYLEFYHAPQGDGEDVTTTCHEKNETWKKIIL